MATNTRERKRKRIATKLVLMVRRIANGWKPPHDTVNNLYRAAVKVLAAQNQKAAS